MYIFRFVLPVLFQVNIVYSQNIPGRQITHPQAIPRPKPLLRRQGNSRTNFQPNRIDVIPKVSVSSGIPNASTVKRRHPVFHNRLRPHTHIPRGNVVDKIGRSRSRKNRKGSKKQRKSSRRKHAKNLGIVKKEMQKGKDIDGPIPIMPLDNSLQDTLPLTFGTLGLLPTSVSIELPPPGSRIQLDRTLDRQNLNNNIRNIQQGNRPLVQTPPDNPIIMRSPQHNRVLVSSPQETPPGFIDTPPQSINDPTVISDTLTGNFQGNTNTRGRFLPRNNQRESTQQFNDVTALQQTPFGTTFPLRAPQSIRSFGTTFPLRAPQSIRFPRRTSLNSGQIMFPARRSAWSGFVPNIPMSLNFLPFLSISDNFDIDDMFLFQNSFIPRRRRFNVFPPLVSQQSIYPEMPFASFAGSPNAFGIQVRGRFNRRMFPTTRSQSVFQTSTPFSAVMTTPPSVQTNSVLPPPSAFFPPVFRDDDFGPFIHQTLYNPYIYDTFLSDFTETSKNNTRTNKRDKMVDRSVASRPQHQDKIQPFYKEKAQRVKMSTTLGINSLYDKNINSQKQHRITRRKPIWYRNFKQLTIQDPPEKQLFRSF